MISEKEEILYALDKIDDTIMESEIDVLDCLAGSYIKTYVMMEQCVDKSDGVTIIQEGQTWDAIKGSAYESTLKRIALAIPRLIRLVAQRIAAFFTNDFKKDVDNGHVQYMYIMQNATPQDIHEMKTEIENTSSGKIKVDEQKGGFTIIGNITTGIAILNGIKVVYDKAMRELDPRNETSYQQFANNIKNILDGKEDFSKETVTLSFESLKQLVADAVDLSGIISVSSKALSHKLEEQVAELEKQGKDPKLLASMQECLTQISRVTKIISIINIIATPFKPILKIIGGVYKKTRKQLLPAGEAKDVMERHNLEEIRARELAAEPNEANKEVLREIYRCEDEVADINDQMRALGNDKEALERRKVLEDRLREMQSKLFTLQDDRNKIRSDINVPSDDLESYNAEVKAQAKDNRQNRYHKKYDTPGKKVKTFFGKDKRNY